MLTRYMEEGKEKKSYKILERSNKEGISPLTYETSDMFSEKHAK